MKLSPTVVNKRTSKYDVYIGRGSIWGNPFIIGKDGNRTQVIRKYLRWILNNPELLNKIHTLKGKRLGCFCKPKNCHGDVLVFLFNKFTGFSNIEVIARNLYLEMFQK